MELFQLMKNQEHEEVVFFYDKASKIKAIVAVHDTTLGPALGGCRMWNYRTETEAIEDVLRLSKAMTYKAAAAGLNVGGGKAVIIRNPRDPNRETIFRTFGRFVNSMKGRYITSQDVGTTVEDMEFVHMETEHVVGIQSISGGSGDPAPLSARGIFVGIKAAARETFGFDDISGLTVAIQGLGAVGYHLASMLHETGCKLIITDIDQDALKRTADKFEAKAVRPDEIYDAKADVFAPCALGGIINDETIPRFKFRIIAGGANNQLKDKHHGQLLKDKGITYAPDYLISAGGLINVSFELDHYDRERAKLRINGIYDTLLKVFQIAREEDIPTYKAADRLAEQRIAAIGRIKRKFGP